MADFTDPKAIAYDEASEMLKAQASILRAAATESNARAEELERAAGTIWHRGYVAQRAADSGAAQ